MGGRKEWEHLAGLLQEKALSRKEKASLFRENKKQKKISRPLGHRRFSGVLAAFPLYLKSRAISFSLLVASWAFIQ